MKIRKTFLVMMIGLAAGSAAFCGAQEAASPDTSGSVPPQQQGEGRGRGQGGPRPLFGKITSINTGTLVITKQDGSTVTVKFTDQTEFRKDREQVKAADFKVGDTVMVRGDENADHTVTAKMIGGRTGEPGGGSGNRPGGGGMAYVGPGRGGTMGKDYVMGEIKSIDAPKLTVLRADSVTQTLELNEGTSLRRGRDSITMADIKVGDRVMAQGAVEDGVFVPKTMMVTSAEQWQRMQQQRMSENAASKSGDSAAPATPPAKPQQ